MSKTVKLTVIRLIVPPLKQMECTANDADESMFLMFTSQAERTTGWLVAQPVLLLLEWIVPRDPSSHDKVLML